MILTSHFLSLDSFGSEPNLDFSGGLNRVSQHDIEQVRCDRLLKSTECAWLPYSYWELSDGFPTSEQPVVTPNRI